MMGQKTHYINSGQFVVARQPAVISTVLGSCVSVCLWDKATKVGAMNHFLLPGSASDDVDDANSGFISTKLLIRSMSKLQVKTMDVEAKIFGGCSTFPKEGDCYKVGENNVAMALRVLLGDGIPVVARHVGGLYGRKIVFDTATGKVRMWLLIKSKHSANEEVDKGIGH